MAQSNPPGRFDYQFEDLIEPDHDIGYDGHRLDADAQRPVPWYQTTPAVLAMVAITVAVIAILVCAVLLIGRRSGGSSNTIAPPGTATPATPAATTPPASTPAPPPSASAPPHPSPTASVVAPTNPPPAATNPPPAATNPPLAATNPPLAPTNPPSAKPPRTGGNGVPITRQPISVAPAPHPAFPHY